MGIHIFLKILMMLFWCRCCCWYLCCHLYSCFVDVDVPSNSDPIISGRILDRRLKPWGCCQISKRFSVHGNWKYNEIQTKTTTYPKIQLVFTSVISKKQKDKLHKCRHFWGGGWYTVGDKRFARSRHSLISLDLMGVFVDSEQKLIFESFWLRFGSICLHFSSRVPLLHATPPTFCLSDFTTPTFLFVSFYNSNLFLCRLIWHFFIVNIALANASIVQFLILYHCLQLESESWEGTKRVHQRNFHFISIMFCCGWG